MILHCVYFYDLKRHEIYKEIPCKTIHIFNYIKAPLCSFKAFGENTKYDDYFKPNMQTYLYVLKIMFLIN